MLRVQEVDQLVKEVCSSLAIHVGRVKDQIVITDYSGQSKKERKKIGDYLKKRGLKINHIKIDHGQGKYPAILIVKK